MNFVQLLLSKTDRNVLNCDSCNKEFTEAHLLSIQFYEEEKKIYWKKKYPIGCTHVKFDGNSWCENCVTIADRQILCYSCGNLWWGEPLFNGNHLKYMWHDGSESSYMDLYSQLNDINVECIHDTK